MTEPVDPPVLYRVVDGVAHLTLNRPHAANAIDLDAAAAFGQGVDSAAADRDVRAVLLTAAGPRFCAGGDLRWMTGGDDRSARVESLAREVDGALTRLGAMRKPVVAAVQGVVAGAGLAVMLSCDLVVAAADTKFAAAYSGVGVTPDCGVTWMLPRLIGQARALEFLCTQRVLTAREALDWGLVARVADDADDAADAATALATSIAAGPALALGETRRLVRESWEVDRATAGANETRTIARMAQEPFAAALFDRFA